MYNKKLFFFKKSLFEFNITFEKDKKKIDYIKLNKIIKQIHLDEFFKKRGLNLDSILSSLL